ncbi:MULTISPECIES: hypothetical protein [Serratia]|uniref:hypothetical protein n=1 Tax=Serratia TaxID=613 RepID=UPI0018E8E3C7|nr:hypothetical protein [Serratia ureilytica]MBJ2089825.1 hypothetical protein [Serratia ureilytica]
MKEYNFDSINTDVPSNSEDTAFALVSAFVALASTVVGNSEEKKEELFSKLDKSIENNQGATSYVELAKIAKATKAILTAKQ